MAIMSWLKQSKNKPLFSDLLWSKPENKRLAGKLLIIGGNSHAFSAPAEAFQAATTTGAGVIRIVLPKSLQKTIGKVLPECEFAPENPSGGFSKAALATCLEHSVWADAILLAGDFGRNSETSILIESIASNYSDILVITKDAADFLISSPQSIIKRSSTTLVISIAQLQKLATTYHSEVTFKFNTTANEFANNLHLFTIKYPLSIVVFHLSQIWVAHAGQVSATEFGNETEIWRVQTAAKVAVWQIQNPGKPFEAITTSVHING